jgi:hypothetical protein
MTSKEPFTGLTGRGVRVAVIDSGVHASHPHVGGVAGGIAFGAEGESADYVDRLGHGTAVAAAILEKAPDVSLFAVKIFDRKLSTSIEVLTRALEWCVEQRMDIVNLSLGAPNPAHRARIEELAGSSRVLVIPDESSVSRPSLPSVISVGLDWECPREVYRCALTERGPIFYASGYPRPIPGVPPERNLHGLSFAVANMTGFVARACQAGGDSFDVLRQALIENAVKLSQAV